MELTEEIVAWVERVSGGKIVSSVHQGRWRHHFFVDVLQPDGKRLKLLARFARKLDLVASSKFLSNYDIAHEAAVLKELQGQGLCIPKFYGFNADPAVILMERVDGSADLSHVSDNDRRTIMRDYIENLAKLHTLEFDVSRFPASAIPDTPQKKSIGSLLTFMEADYYCVRDKIRPEPLLDFAIWWLNENVPHTGEARLIQGDTGPGQFMADNGRITALIDWELCHFGDPMVDLGVMRMRNMLYPVGELRPHLEYYAELTGKPLDRHAICFQTVSATLQSPLGIAASIQTPTAGIESMVPRLGWDVTLRRGLCDALCEAFEIEVEPPRFPQDTWDERSDISRFLAEYLETVCFPLVQGDYDRFLMRGAVGLARTLELGQRHGRQIERDDLDDMGVVLGVRPSGREVGLTELGKLVAHSPETCAKDLLWLFSRMEQRREYLWKPIMIAQQSRPLERLYPAIEVYSPTAAVKAEMVGTLPC